MLKGKFCFIIPAFHFNRITRAINSFKRHNLGESYDIFIIHNKFEVQNIKNRLVKSKEEVKAIEKFCLKESKENSNIKYFERDNIGEDIGAYRYGYHKALEYDYKRYFFFSEMAVCRRDGFLSEYDYIFNNSSQIGLICPHIGPGIKYTFAVKTSYFCIRKELKLDPWPEPLSRTDTERQEMEYFYPFIKYKKFYMMQHGCGNDHITYLDDHNQETHLKFLFRGRLLGSFLV